MAPYITFQIMARSKNTVTAADKKNISDQADKKAEAAADNKDNKNIPEYVDELMRLYPQYEEIWVTSKGFVHPKDAPGYLTKNAVLYKNKYYKP